MSQEPWELLRDHDFGEEQWQKILKPLGNVQITAEDREELVIIEIIYFASRFKEFSAKQFEWILRPAQTARCLMDVYKAAWKLRSAMANAKLDIEILPDAAYAIRDPSDESPAFSWNRQSWDELLAKVHSLENGAKRKAEQWAGVKAPPINVDQARDEAWGRLAEIYVRLTGKKPAASPRITKKDNRGKYADGYGGFVEAFMTALREEPPGDDEIPNFLRSRQYRERVQKFLNAHPGLLREHQHKKPLKRS